MSMADATDSNTPLLTNSAYSDHLKAKNQRPDAAASNEAIIEAHLRDLTWHQVLQIILICLASFFMAQQTFLTIFTDAKPSWHCINPEDNACNPGSNICQLPSDAWSWDKPAYTSTISEWSLNCAANPIIAGLPASSFFMGCLFGGIIVFFIGDSFGRKKMVFVSCLVMSLGSFFTAFSNNVWTYSVLRFVSGIGRAATGSCGLVLAKETVGKQRQGKVVTIIFLIFALGFVLLPPMAYYTQNYSWRVLYLITSIPTILYCIFLHFLAYESPIWLVGQERKEVAIAVLKSIAPSDAKHLIISWNFPTGLANQDLKANSKLSFFKILMKKRDILQQLFLCMLIASGIGVVYYGMALGVNTMDFDLYWSAVFNSSLQIPSNLLILFTVSKWKRRSTLLSLSIIAGVCCILMCFNADLQVSLELASFFCSATSFMLFLLYAAELFPIYIRNSAVALVWLALTLGGAISPVLIAAGGDNKFLSYGVFGVLIIATGLLIIFLPETLVSLAPCDCEDEEAASA